MRVSFWLFIILNRVKLRDTSFSYQLPAKLLNKTPFGRASLAVSGSNIYFGRQKKTDMLIRKLTFLEQTTRKVVRLWVSHRQEVLVFLSATF